MSYTPFIRAAMLVGLYGFATLSQALPASYTIQAIPITNIDINNAVLLLNENGQVAGSEYTNNGSRLGTLRVFLWSNGSLTYISENKGFIAVKGFNDSNQIVGYSLEFDDNDNYQGQLGFTWSNGLLTTLGTLNPNDHFEATAVNASGQVLLTHRYEPDNDTSIAEFFVWDKGKIMHLDGMAGAFAINASGQVAGYVLTDGNSDPAVWANGSVTVLKTPTTFSAMNTTINASSSVARLINDNGQVAGTLGGFEHINDPLDIFIEHVFLWTNGVTTHLTNDDVRKALSTSAIGRHINLSDYYDVQLRALNAKGAVAGTIGLPFLYSATLGLKLIPLLNYCDDPNSNGAHSNDMNDAGIVVGASTRGLKPFNAGNIQGCETSGSGVHAFIYESEGTGQGITTDLNTLIAGNSGWELSDALAINNRGQILVAGNKGYALLTPSTTVPEPTPKASCDANQDHKVDKNDLAMMQPYVRKFNPAYDIDGDGIVNVTDLRKCVLQCTKAKCAP
jgi:uncharacterized membrane protein